MGSIESLPPISDSKTLAPALGTTERHLMELRARREGPPWIRVGRKVRYDRDAVKAWVTANTVAVA